MASLPQAGTKIRQLPGMWKKDHPAVYGQAKEILLPLLQEQILE